MSRSACRVLTALVLAVVGLQAQSPGLPSTKNGDWLHYTADVRGTKVLAARSDQRVELQQARGGVAVQDRQSRTFPEYKLEGTPLAIGGVLYTTAGTRRDVIALDGKTGEVIWVHSLREGKRAAVSPRQLSGRGVSYWTDGSGDERIVYVTTGYRLVELDAKTGAPVQAFGKDGVVDLKVGVVKGKGEQIDLETGEIGVHSTPPVVEGRDRSIGSAMREGATVSTHNNTKGLVRAFDARTGKKLWRSTRFRGPASSATTRWENESWATNGNVGVWTQITVDEEAGLVVSAGRDADLGLLRRASSRQQPVRRNAGLRRSEDRPAQVVLPVHAPSALELRHVVGAARGRRHRRRPAAQGGRGAEQAGLAVRVRSRSPGSRSGRSSRSRCRSPTCRARRRRRRSRIRPTSCRYARNTFKLPDDLIDFTPRAARRGGRAREVLQVERSRRSCRRCSATSNGPLYGADRRRHGDQLAGRRLRSGAAHRRSRRPATCRASRSLVAPPPGFSDIRYVSGIGGQDVPRSARTGRLLRRRFAAHGAARDRSARRRRRAAPSRRSAAAPRAARRRRCAAV